MYNGPSQVYCIKPKRRVHMYTKGFYDQFIDLSHYNLFLAEVGEGGIIVHITYSKTSKIRTSIFRNTQ